MYCDAGTNCDVIREVKLPMSNGCLLFFLVEYFLNSFSNLTKVSFLVIGLKNSLSVTCFLEKNRMQ